MYMKAYAYMISPLPDSKLWPDTKKEKILPPGYKPMPGRPPKERRRHPDEPKNKNKRSRSGYKIKCSKCFLFGHNARRCTGKRPSADNTQQSSSSTRGKSGRPPIPKGEIGSNYSSYDSSPLREYTTNAAAGGTETRRGGNSRKGRGRGRAPLDEFRSYEACTSSAIRGRSKQQIRGGKADVPSGRGGNVGQRHGWIPSGSSGGLFGSVSRGHFSTVPRNEVPKLVVKKPTKETILKSSFPIHTPSTQSSQVTKLTQEDARQAKDIGSKAGQDSVEFTL